jgi:hypothetical protein
MHDGAVYFSPWPSDNVELVEKFNNSELRNSSLIDISDGDIALGLEVGDIELKEFGIQSQSSQVLYLSEFERCSLHSNQIYMISTCRINRIYTVKIIELIGQAKPNSLRADLPPIWN